MQNPKAMDVSPPKIEKAKQPDNEKADETDGELINKDIQRQKLLTSIYNYLIVLSSILIVFAACRNTLTW